MRNKEFTTEIGVFLLVFLTLFFLGFFEISYLLLSLILMLFYSFYVYLIIKRERSSIWSIDLNLETETIENSNLNHYPNHVEQAYLHPLSLFSHPSSFPSLIISPLLFLVYSSFSNTKCLNNPSSTLRAISFSSTESILLYIITSCVLCAPGSIFDGLQFPGVLGAPRLGPGPRVRHPHDCHQLHHQTLPHTRKC